MHWAWDHRDGFIHVPKGKSVISQHQTTLAIAGQIPVKKEFSRSQDSEKPSISDRQAFSLLIPGFIRIHGETTPAGVPSDSRHPDLQPPDHLSSYPPSRYRSSSLLSADHSSSGPVGNSINPSSLDAETKSRTAASARSSPRRKLLYHPSLSPAVYPHSDFCISLRDNGRRFLLSAPRAFGASPFTMLPAQAN